MNGESGAPAHQSHTKILHDERSHRVNPPADVRMQPKIFARSLPWFTTALLICLTAPLEANWRGGVEGGTEIRKSGAATRLTLTLSNDSRPLSQYINADWIRDASGGNGYRLGYVPRYWFNDTLYGFAEGRFRVDEPIGVESEARVLTGAGLLWTPAENAYVSAEAGVGGRRLELNNLFTDTEITTEALGVLRASTAIQFLGAFKADASADIAGSSEGVDGITEAGISVLIPGGSLRYALQTRWLNLDSGDTARISETFISYGYRF